MVYCDVDDTLICWSPELYPHQEADLVTINDYDRQFQFLPHKKHLDFLHKLKLQGYGIVIWSAAGASWAETVVIALGIQDIPDMILSKPELAMDDFLEAKQIIKSILWIHPETGEYLRNK